MRKYIFIHTKLERLDWSCFIKNFSMRCKNMSLKFGCLRHIFCSSTINLMLRNMLTILNIFVFVLFQVVVL